LLYPEPSIDRLLGHAISFGPDGSVQIAEELAPGCEVSVERLANAVDFERETELREATSVGAGYGGIASFEAKWGSGLRAAIRAKNTELARAKLVGACGAEVVSEVFVGTGERTILRGAGVAGNVQAAGMGAGAGAGTDRSARELERQSWSSPQVYAFNTTKRAVEEALDLEVKVPTRIVEGDDVRFSFTATEDAMLVVYFVGADGKGEVLLPSNEEPRPRAAKGVPFTMPTAAQASAGVSFRAALAAKGKATKERLIVFALREEADFRMVRNALDEAGPDAAKAETALKAALEKLPPSRWSKRSVTYEILSK
jgi:hypothetical protein